MKCQVSNVERGAWTEFVVRCDPYNTNKIQRSMRNVQKVKPFITFKIFIDLCFYMDVVCACFFSSSLCSIPWNSDWMLVQHHCVHLWMYACMDSFCVNIFDLVVYWKLMSEFTFDIRIWKCCKSSNGWMRNPFPSFAMSIMRGYFTMYIYIEYGEIDVLHAVDTFIYTDTRRVSDATRICQSWLDDFCAMLSMYVCVFACFFFSHHCVVFIVVISVGLYFRSERVCVFFSPFGCIVVPMRCVALCCVLFWMLFLSCPAWHISDYFCLSKWIFMNGVVFPNTKHNDNKNQPSPTYPLVFLFLVVSLPLRIWRLM